MKVLVLYYSMYGHIRKMADAVVEGAREAGAEVTLLRVPETLPAEVLQKMYAPAPDESIRVATPDDLKAADAIIFGVPTRYGNMCGQMQQFLDSTGGLWATGALVGKVGSGFVSTATQHGGQETTLRALHTALLHHGMVIVGLPYAWQGQMTLDEITGGSPYGASTISGGQGERQPSENELAGARWQGRHVAQIAGKLAA